jgi:hypothetical protein
VIDAVKASKGRIILLDIDGKKVYEKGYSLSEGRSQTSLSLAGLSNGTYVVAVYNNLNELIATHTIIKQ